ncbi:MAG: hypothetical protein ACNYPI_11830 [Arenicellales bacterium WSBS_2016_MAG_OTU3]
MLWQQDATDILRLTVIEVVNIKAKKALRFHTPDCGIEVNTFFIKE